MNPPPSFEGHRTASARRNVKAWRLVVLAGVSAFLTLAVCEAGLRLFTSYGRHAFAAATTRLLDEGRADRFVQRMGAAPGTDRSWFREDPTPVEHGPVSEERIERSRDYERRGLFGPQADYIWNRAFVETQRCAPKGVFGGFPEKVLVFDPPSFSPFPRYRFPPETTTPWHLVTNRFGLRGRPLALAKPPGTVRIAFLGASTTVGFHGFPFSYPEYVVHWLNRFAESNGYSVRFEALNGGREGLHSQDIAGILRDELLPLSPDLAIYYEGSNQFGAANDLVSPRIPPRKQVDPQAEAPANPVPEALRTHLALGNLANRALNRFRDVSEPPKPAYKLTWPEGVDFRTPDVDHPGLPLSLPAILRDLDTMRKDVAGAGGRLILSTFVWLADEGMALSPSRHQHIYQHLNTVLWPLRYADIRRLADFQNRVFRRYARDRGLDLLDVAEAMPPAPDLFVDAIHMTEAGDRLRAWIAFQQLAPIIRREIEAGRLPRHGPERLPAPPSLATAESTVRCGDAPAQPLVRIAGAASLDMIAPAYPEASVRFGRPVEVVTAGLESSYAGLLPFYVPPTLDGPRYLMIRGRVLEGRIALGVTGSKGSPRLSKHLTPGGTIDVYLPLVHGESARLLVISNAAENGVRSRILIDDVGLMALASPPPAELFRSIGLESLHLADPQAAIERREQRAVVTTKAEQYSYAGRLLLGLGARAGDKLSVHIRARVLDGNVGFCILSPDGREFLEERSVWPSGGTTEIILPLPSPPVTGDLVIRNSAPGNVRSKAIVESIEIRRAR